MSVADRVIAVCEQQSGKEAQRDSRLVEDLELDSLDRVELAMVLEDTFRIEIPDHEVDDPKLSSVAALIDMVDHKLEVKTAIAKVSMSSTYGTIHNRPGAEL